MQKALALLEQHVQWLALGIAVLFFGYCVYSYVITPPAEQTVKGVKDPMTPQNVDQTIKDGPVQEITRNTDAIPDSDKGFAGITPPDVVGPWQKQMKAPMVLP